MTTNRATPGIDPFRDRLQRLETALDEPPVPGEMRAWAATTRKAFDETGKEFLKQLDTIHAPQFQEIEGQDPELIARITALREEDCHHRQWYDRLAKAFAEFEASAEKAGADEKQVLERQHKLLEDALSFVVHVRKQEVAVRSWSQEAFERDTGVAD